LATVVAISRAKRTVRAIRHLCIPCSSSNFNVLSPSCQESTVKRFHLHTRVALVALAGAAVVSCNESLTTPSTLAPRGANFDLSAPSQIVISQVYGGGGNSGATLTNDFIELYNASSHTVSLDGWSVQYASSSGSTWQVTPLSGTIAAGGYYLIEEAAGSGGTTPLPTPNAIDNTAMSASSGKVALVSNATALSGTCPAADAIVVDFVGFGGANCFEGSGHTATLSATKAAIRSNPAQDTNDNAADFVTGAPNPHNGPSDGVATTGPLARAIVAGPASAAINASLTFVALAQDATRQTIEDPAATYTWASSDPSVAAIDSVSGDTAFVSAIAVDAAPVTISVSVAIGGTTVAATHELTVTPPVPGHVSIGVGTDPLVIGYQTQLFVTGGSADDSGNPVYSSMVTWSSSNPTILSVDNRGIVTARAEGFATLTGTAADGTAGSYTLDTEVPFYSSSARAGHNTELGTPTDRDPSNDVLIERKQYTISYNPQRGGPNWVSWDLSASHLGKRNRCNCYTADTALARLGYGQYMYTTADYTGGGYDRGHMEPSADQTTTDGENATTFFLTNFLPQTHALNAGPWEKLENALRDSVNSGREAYVIAGGVFTNGVGLGSLKNEGKIFIPDSTWKIVVLMPANTGLENISSTSDVDVIAVNMPNIGNPAGDWTAFRTTVGKIQRSTGYDFLASLPDAIECRVEFDCSPVVNAFDGATLLSGETYAATGTFSDVDGDAWTASASYGDNSAVVATPVNEFSFQLSHTYSAAGTFTVTATVNDGYTSTSRTATVVVETPSQGVANLDAAVDNLAALSASLRATSATQQSAGLNTGELNALHAKLDAASADLARANRQAAVNTLGAFVNQLQSMIDTGRVPAASGSPIIAYAQRVIRSIDAR
jgi:DNA/RNA endonuclease G (NUC1)